MKRISGLLAVLLLTAALFTGCTGTEKAFTCGELSITLPADYADLSQQDYAADFDFLYGLPNEAVLGFKQARASLEASRPDLTAKEYAQLFIDAAELSCTVEELDGLILFTYTAIAGDTEVTYLCSSFRSETNFWIIQFYCPSNTYSQHEADFIRYLRSVKV